MYEEITNFVRDECAREHTLDHLNGEIPSAILKALRTKINDDNPFNVSKQDAICKQVYDQESQWRKDQIAEIIEFIGDIPKYSIGTQIQDIDSGISLEKLIEDVLKLPNMGMVEPENDEGGRNSKVLTEYTNLREDLVDKCKAIRLGESTALDTGNQARILRSIIATTVENSPDYFVTYHGKISDNLHELRYLLEEAIKSSDFNAEKRSRLQKMLENL